MSPDAGPLQLIEEWPVDTAAAAVVGPEGLRHSIGALDHRFWLASLTKPMFATAVLLAVEEETLSLDQPAGPEGSTVRHLLAHASGLGLDGLELARPGRRRIYSNAGFDVLGRELEAASGLTAADYLAEGVLGPLGMDGAQLRGSPAHAATGTVTDLVAFVGELLRPRLLAPKTWAQATQVAFPGLDGLVPGYGKQSPNDWGLGFEIRSHKAPHWTAAESRPETYGHFGRSGGFFWVDPVAAVALVALTDRDFDAWARPRWPALSSAVLEATR